MRFITILFVFLLFSCSTLAQNIVDFFLLMPKGRFEFLSKEARDSLVRQGKYYPPDNVPDVEVITYSLSVDSSRNYLRVEMNFETGQSAFSICELRAWRTTSQHFIVVYSEVSGAPGFFGQGDLLVFEYGKDKTLRPFKKELLPSSIGLDAFIKPNTPDSVGSEYASYSNNSYNLMHAEGEVVYCLYENFKAYGIDRKWLLGNLIAFRWVDDHFERNQPYFEEDRVP
jgi:hypothetical protein